MSTHAVASFLAQLTEDDVKKELELGGKTKKEGIVAIVQLAGRRGFDFTEEECAAVLDVAKKMQAGELDDAQLEAVAGGVDVPDETWDALAGGIDSALSDFRDWWNEDDDDDDSNDGPSYYNDGQRTAVAGVRG